MELFGTVLAALYGGLMIIATYQERPLTPASGVIIVGGLLNFAYAFIRYVNHDHQIGLLICGMAIISLGTIINGIKQKDFHISHHFIRLIVEALIVIICWKV